MAQPKSREISKEIIDSLTEEKLKAYINALTKPTEENLDNLEGSNILMGILEKIVEISPKAAEDKLYKELVTQHQKILEHQKTKEDGKTNNNTTN